MKGKTMNGHKDGTITETPIKDVKVGMVRAWNDGRSSEIVEIFKLSPRARTLRIAYRSTQARPDGHRNTIDLEATPGTFLPIITTDAPTAGPCPSDCEPCAHQAAVEAFMTANGTARVKFHV